MAQQTRRGRPTKAQTEAKKRQAALEKKKKQRYRNMSLLLFALGVFFMVLSLLSGSAAWNAIQKVYFGLFGICAYIIGPILLLVAVLCAYEKSFTRSQVISTILLALAVSGIFLIFSKNEVEGADFIDKIKNLYLSGTLKSGGGVFSALLGWGLLALCGRPVANIVICLLVFVLLMVLTGKSLIDLIENIRTPIQQRREQRLEELALLEELDEEDEPLAEQPHKPVVAGKKSKVTVKSTEVYDYEELERKRTQIDIPIDTVGVVPPGKSRINIPIDPVSADPRALTQELDIPEPMRGGANAAAPQSEPRSEIDDLLSEAFDKLDAKKRNEDIFAHFGDDAPFGAAAPSANAEQEQLIEKAMRKQDEKPAAPVKKTESYSDIEYKFPPFSILAKQKDKYDERQVSQELRSNAEFLVQTLDSFGVKTKIIDIARGPTVTRYELQPQSGVRLNRITNLADDIALNLATSGVRIEAPVPNKAAVGIEVPNKKKEMVYLRSVIESPEFQNAKSPLTVALGKAITGDVMVTDIAKMPHLLIAGTTGSGKSKCLHSMIISLMYKSAPKDLRFIFIDPKMVEFGIYNGIPHLMIPVVTDAKKASGALSWAVGEMMKRYSMFSRNGVRDIDAYNARIEKRTLPDFRKEGEEDYQEPQKLARVVVVIDELADLMMVAPNEVEDAICRLAQMARAAGLHLIIATQRPSVDVITGLIKANISSRIALAVSSQIDSRTIMDMGGAEKLLGYGDMLFRPMDKPKPVRIQGCFVSDDEVEQVVDYVKQNAVIDYNEAVMDEIERLAMKEGKGSTGGAMAAGGEDTDDMLESAVNVVLEAGQASTSLLQRKLKLGYARAARIMDTMEEMGVVGPPEGSKPRAVLMSKQDWYERELYNPSTDE